MPVTVPPAFVRAGLRASRPLFASRRIPLGAKRRLVDVLTGMARAPRDTSLSAGRVAGVDVQRAVAPGTAGRGALLYLHGGGYALGGARAYRGVAAHLASAAGVEAVVADYRRAPEHPYPAALEDALSVYEALLEEWGSPRHLVVAGDSAGGGLTLALLLALRARGLPQPAAAALICPWLDLTVDVARTRLPARDPLVVPAMLREWAAPYAGEADPGDPGISPLRGDLGGLAPLIVDSAGDDPLAADAEALEARIRATPAAGPFEHLRHPGRWHVFHLQLAVLADAGLAVEALGRRLAAHLDVAPAPAVAPPAGVHA